MKLVLLLHHFFDFLQRLLLIERELFDLILHCIPVFGHGSDTEDGSKLRTKKRDTRLLRCATLDSSPANHRSQLQITANATTWNYGIYKVDDMMNAGDRSEGNNKCKSRVQDYKTESAQLWR